MFVVLASEDCRLQIGWCYLCFIEWFLFCHFYTSQTKTIIVITRKVGISMKITVTHTVFNTTRCRIQKDKAKKRTVKNVFIQMRLCVIVFFLMKSKI